MPGVPMPKPPPKPHPMPKPKKKKHYGMVALALLFALPAFADTTIVDGRSLSPTYTDLTVTDDATIGDELTVNGAFTANAASNLGNAAADIITLGGVTKATAQSSSHSLTAAGDVILNNLETNGAFYSDGAATVAGALTASAGGSLTGTWTNLGTVTTMDLNGGTIDGTAIGGAVPAAGAFTTLDASATVTFQSTTVIDTDHAAALLVRKNGAGTTVLNVDTSGVGVVTAYDLNLTTALSFVAGQAIDDGTNSRILFNAGDTTINNGNADFDLIVNGDVTGESAAYDAGLGKFTVTNLAIGETTVNGLTLADTTASDVTTDHFAPTLNMCGTGYKTNATAASQAVCINTRLETFQAAATPDYTYRWDHTVDGGADDLLMYYTTAGVDSLNVTGAITSTATVTAGTGLSTNAGNLTFAATSGTSKIVTGSGAGVAHAMHYDIVIGAGGAADAAIDHQFLLDGVLEAGLLAETDGSGSYRDPVFKIPYYTADYGAAWASVSLPAPASLANGSEAVLYNSNGAVLASRRYTYTNGAWTYVALLP